MCYLQHPPDAPFPPAPPPPCLVLAPVTEIDLPWGRLPPLEGSMAILFLLTNRYISEVQGAVMIRVTLGKRLGVEFFYVKLIREKDFFFFLCETNLSFTGREIFIFKFTFCYNSKINFVNTSINVSGRINRMSLSSLFII